VRGPLTATATGIAAGYRATACGASCRRGYHACASRRVEAFPTPVLALLPVFQAAWRAGHLIISPLEHRWGVPACFYLSTMMDAPFLLVPQFSMERLFCISISVFCVLLVSGAGVVRTRLLRVDLCLAPDHCRTGLGCTACLNGGICGRVEPKRTFSIATGTWC